MIEILQDSLDTESLGYASCDPKLCGEYLCIGHFLKDGMTVFDVGANDGEWTKQALRSANCVVHAFEPAKFAYDEMVRDVASFFDGKVFVSNVGLGARIERRTLYVSTPTKPDQPHPSQVSSVWLENVKQHEDVGYVEQPDTQFITLDEYAILAPRIDYLKIDTEGMELDVLKGAVKTLARKVIDIVQFEYGTKYGDHATLRQVFELLQAHGFKLHRIIPTGLLHTPVWRPELECRRFCNYIALRKP